MLKVGQFLSKIAHTIQHYDLLHSGETVLVGVSGGPDSVALTLCLQKLSAQFNLNLILVHINHSLRGREADTDEEFVKELATRLGLKLICRRINVLAAQRRYQTSIEATARILRYRTFVSVAKKMQASAVALGHHQNDLAETVLLQLLRGTGMSGLAGFSAKVTIDGIRFIRPFYDTSRDEIMQFLVHQGADYRLDSSNLDRRFLRNKIRLELIPFLEKHYNPNIIKTLCRTGEIVAREDEYLERVALQIFELLKKAGTQQFKILSLKFLQQLHPALLRRVLRLWSQELLQTYTPLSFSEIESIITLINRGETGKYVLLANRLLIYRVYRFIIAHILPARKTPGRYPEKAITRAIKQILQKHLLQLGYNFITIPKNLSYTLTVKALRKLSKRKTICLGKHHLIISKTHEKQNDTLSYALNLNDFTGKFEFRTPQQGDRITLQDSTKPLNRYLSDKKIPQQLRQNVLILCYEKNVLWIPGITKMANKKLRRSANEIVYFTLVKRCDDAGRIKTLKIEEGR
ncbi:MAG: tRNA lysidine(34) synthetase TilS [Candidatus Sumerlaeia bacterium]|nr:tRNA lysidine(34) synthetase TilS [Candidatus Sumerlaeia bacterium]